MSSTRPAARHHDLLMMRRPSLFIRIFIFCLLLFLIYPASPVLFKKFISFKEPVFLCPVESGCAVSIRSDVMGDGHFGARRSGGRRRHKGLDIDGPIGEPVLAAKSGFAKTGEVPSGMGMYIKVVHLDGYVTLYGHLSSVDIPNGAWVWQGQKIGEVGKTGNANYRRMKPHLHFEIRKDDRHLDPLPLITKTNESK